MVCWGGIKTAFSQVFGIIKEWPLVDRRSLDSAQVRRPMYPRVGEESLFWS